MRVVGGEHEQLRSRLVKHPPDGLTGERGELEVAANVIRGWEFELAQRLLGPSKRPEAIVQMPHPGHDPTGTLFDAATPQLGEAIEQSVVDERS